jgi:hypothetical protein
VVQQGGHQSFTVLALRRDGFAGDITLTAEGLPPGVTAPPQTMGGAVSQAEFVVSAAAGAAPWAGEIKIKGTAIIGGQPAVREARPATVVWPIPATQNIPTLTRLDRSLALAVRPAAPYSLTAALDKDMVAQGDKAALAVKLARLWPDLKTPLTVQARTAELPSGLTVNNNQIFTLPPDKADGTLPVVVGPTVTPGTYTLVLRTSTIAPYSKDPAAKQKPQTLIIQPSAPVTLTVLPKVVATVATAGVPSVKPGAQAEVVVRVARQYRYDGEFKVQVVLPPAAKGLTVGEAVIPPGKDEARLPLTVAADAAPGNRADLVVKATALLHGKVAITHEAKFNVNVVK